MYRIRSKQKVLILLCLSIAITTSFASTTDFGLATPENKTLMQPQGIQNMSTNATNIVLVHGAWADASGWNKQIPVLRDAGHKIIAVQLPLHSLTLPPHSLTLPPQVKVSTGSERNTEHILKEFATSNHPWA